MLTVSIIQRYSVLLSETLATEGRSTTRYNNPISTMNKTLGSEHLKSYKNHGFLIVYRLFIGKLKRTEARNAFHQHKMLLLDV